MIAQPVFGHGLVATGNRIQRSEHPDQQHRKFERLGARLQQEIQPLHARDRRRGDTQNIGRAGSIQAQPLGSGDDSLGDDPALRCRIHGGLGVNIHGTNPFLGKNIAYLFPQTRRPG
ncbi:hypothetical protein AT6N2_C1585 [Agrobacterium tumefaciens]|nr:hypothetical protein AT6N2_C1585 [Agrobacterium tumefaciens]